MLQSELDVYVLRFSFSSFCICDKLSYKGLSWFVCILCSYYNYCYTPPGF